MAINPKSQNSTNSAPRASTQKNYQETSAEIEKRGNKTHRVEEIDDEQKATFENSEQIKYPFKINSSLINAEPDEEEETEDESEYDEDESDDDESEGDEDEDEEDEDDESDDDSEGQDKLRKANQQKVPTPLNGTNGPRAQTSNERTSQTKKNDRKF
jgi:hypothetical protein